MKPYSYLFIGTLFLSAGVSAQGQGRLDKKISISIRQKALTQALKEIGRKGGFTFSYNTTILNGDRLVDAEAEDRPVRQVLEQLLGDGYEYTESGKYVIILQRTNAPPVRQYMISGYIKDDSTQERLGNVSVYESGQLVSTLTDTNGFFRLRLRDNKYSHAELVISKQFYRDTVLFFRPGYDQQVTVPIAREKISDLTPFVVSNKVEKTWVGKLFLSSKQIVQSLNLGDFFANKPVQMSLIPGLGTHGRMSGQVVNKLSCNLIAGYSAGTKGVELAGIANFDKGEVRGVQASGIADLVGGKVSGVQLAGIHNEDLDSLRGVQAGGISNRVWGSMEGVQLSGIANETKGDVYGVQVSGILNKARNVKGMQIGVVNLADSCSGFMIGIVNIVRNGMHEWSVFSNEMMPINVAYKSGTRKMYTIIQASADISSDERAYGYGIGIGNELGLGRRFALNTEYVFSTFIVGHGRELPGVSRLQTMLRCRMWRNFSLYAGPSISITSPTKVLNPDGYKMILPRAGYHRFGVGNAVAWVGWTVGINFF
ncbi:MAG: hypothetical protein JST42_21625 [Bacteroidetes bacterium]|nr:hypothetical protein [Bacteroidota bacterium]